jgi:ABC-type polysaccharide/polyol phosphate transport system ATPase subunit
VTIIKAENLSKFFTVSLDKRNTLKELFLSFYKPTQKIQVKALEQVNFTVNQGETLGIVGDNGSGKSTLLKIISGIYKPSAGEVQINGVISPILELGIGFNEELSGRENIFLSAVILGASNSFIKSSLAEIIGFADIGDFIDSRVKNYSTGMKMRLAFAVAIHMNADIYICDEVLAVGDQHFQEKCLNKIKNLKSAGKTIIFTSHDLGLIESLCDRAILLSKGKLLQDAAAKEVIENYKRL